MADATETTTQTTATKAPVGSVEGSSDLASHKVSPTTEDNEQTQEQNIEDAKALAMHNHAVEHAEDPIPTSGDKTRV